MAGSPAPDSIEHARDALQSARTVAVLGAHSDPGRAAHYVPAYLAQNGYRIIPVNPAKAGETLFGERVRETLAEIGERVDVVDVFRRSELVAGHLDDILAMDPPPRLVWLQKGIRDDATAAKLRAADIEVIQDRCMLADHRRLGLGAG